MGCTEEPITQLSRSVLLAIALLLKMPAIFFSSYKVGDQQGKASRYFHRRPREREHKLYMSSFIPDNGRSTHYTRRYTEKNSSSTASWRRKNISGPERVWNCTPPSPEWFIAGFFVGVTPQNHSRSHVIVKLHRMWGWCSCI